MRANLTAMTWWHYVEQTAPGRPQEEIARRVGVSAATVTRWKVSEPRPSNVAAFARAYGRPVLEAFVAAGFLTAQEADTQVIVTRYEDPSDEEILELLARRLRRDREDVSDDDQHRPPIAAGETRPLTVTIADAVEVPIPPPPAAARPRRARAPRPTEPD